MGEHALQDHSDEGLAERATAVYRLIDDLSFGDVCRVLNAVLTAKTEVSSIAPATTGELCDEQFKLGIEDGESRPSHCTVGDRPELEQVEIFVPNKLTVLTNDIKGRVSSEGVDKHATHSECRNLNVASWNMTFSRDII